MKLKFKRNDIIGAIFFIAFVVSTTLIYQFDEKFSEEYWTTRPSKRHNMVDDLLERELLKDKTKMEVISLLGQPSSDGFREKDYFIYNLGKPPSFTKPQLKKLLIVFEDEKVSSAVVTP
jgi:hypothetical protein